jgi:hypothetical protein
MPLKPSKMPGKGKGKSKNSGNSNGKRRRVDKNDAEANEQPTHVDDGSAGEAAASAGASADPEVNGTCIICLDNDPLPIQSGCACRGDAGLAHVDCRAEAAAHRATHKGEWGGWRKCGTCGQEFTGPMQLGLAEEWWSRVQSLPEEDDQRLGAAHNLAGALHGHGKDVEAEAVYREVLVIQHRVLGPEHPNTLATATNLANTLHPQGKDVEAEAVYRDVLVVQQRVLGSEHPHTLVTARNLATCVPCARDAADSAK